MKRLAAALLFVVIGGAGCAMGDKAARPAESPQAATANAPAQPGAQAPPPPPAEQGMKSDVQAPPPVVMPTKPGAPSGTGGAYAVPPPSPAMANAQGELERGSIALEKAGSQCQDACRALSSMDRATGRICGLEIGERCSDAKQKLYSARDRVRSSCGTCSDGTATERNAPVPSR